MSETVAWRYQKPINPTFDPPAEHHILRGCVPTCTGDEGIEGGFVESVLEPVAMIFKEGRYFV